MSGKRKRGEETELEDTTVAKPCKMARVGKEESDNNNMMNVILPSLATPHKYPIAKEKKVVAVVLLPSATKDTKINAPAGESSA